MKPVSSLTDDQLIGLLTGNRRSARRVQDGDVLRLESLLDYVPLDQWMLQRQLGLGPSQARRLAAAIELGKRLLRAERPAKAHFASPEMVMQFLGEICLDESESFWALPLNARLCLVGDPICIAKGDIDGCDAGPRAFYRAVLRRGATAAIAVHNHPTGGLQPSAADRAVTRRLAAVGRDLDIQLTDHVILAPPQRYLSLRREEPGLWSRT